MRICDKCGQPAGRTVTLPRDHDSFDLCETHYDKLQEWMNTKNKKPGRKPKDKK